MDPLSAVANIAAIIGLLDLSCRAGKEICNLISTIKHAPAEIENLKTELEEIEFLLVNLNRYCYQYQRQHPWALHESNSALRRICDILRGLQIEYKSTNEIITSYSISRTGTRDKLRGMKEKVRLAIRGKLAAACKTLDIYKARLSTSLQILSGYVDTPCLGRMKLTYSKISFNDLAIHDQIGSLTQTFAGLAYDTLPPTNAVYYSDAKYSPTIKQLPHSTMPISNPEKSFYGDTAEKLHQHDQAAGCWGEGEEMSSAVLPLMLFRSTIEKTLRLIISERPERTSIPSQDCLWIADELKGLLAKCHESAAVTLTQQPHDMKSNTNTNDPKGRATKKYSQSPVRSLVSATNKKIISTSCLVQESPTGKISVRLQFTQDIQSGETTISNAFLLLAPDPSISRDGVSISLSRLQGNVKQPQIQRLLSIHTVVEAKSPAFDCVRLNDIQTLKELLKTRQASPSIRSTENESLLSLAARLLRFEICELLLHEGADPNNCRSDGASAIFDVRNAFWYRPTNYKIPKSLLNQFLRLFVRSGCDINSTALGGGALHFTISQCVSESETIQEAEIATLVNLIICLGGDIEHRNADGLTPLLYNACTPGIHGVTVLNELLQWGADPHAQSLLGEGALHLAIAFSIQMLPDSGLGSNSLQGRLCALLKAGCDPTLEDNQGHTPSDFALSSPRTWFQWCLSIMNIRHLSMIQILAQETPAGFGKGAANAGAADSAECQPVGEDLSTDWESCSDSCTDSEDEQSERGDYQPSQTCSQPRHIFLSWNGKFPWSIHPSCMDCGLLCDLQDIHPRKLAAWKIFQGLLSRLDRL
ncbi:ankyrin repeat protein [Penicillium nucicola]|uniref:ankyrin repeat protein n=1 Tax=Penicillium nucicola TaxID=1850975 RepID=UPI002544ED65|nr:ankyrin repeat protein [Penicillium nucicola]KAJ5776445.1 ankyrin repeat protein [Penicillium nucicola]